MYVVCDFPVRKFADLCRWVSEREEDLCAGFLPVSIATIVCVLTVAQPASHPVSLVLLLLLLLVGYRAAASRTNPPVSFESRKLI